MSAQLKELFDRVCSHLKYDRRMAGSLQHTVQAFKTKNEDHLMFFGTGLLGVYPVKFTGEDRDWLFDEVFRIDEYALRQDLLKLKSPKDPSEPLIPEEYNVLSDPLNHLLLYTVYRFKDSDLSQSVSLQAQQDCVRLLHYKFSSSLLSEYFHYPADPAVAKVAFENFDSVVARLLKDHPTELSEESLSQRFDIKRLGTWSALFDSRAEHFVSREGLHVQTLLKYGPDEACLYMVSDMQTRIRNVIKDYTKVFYDVRSSNSRVVTTSSVIESSEGTFIRDVSRVYHDLMRYLQQVALEPKNFVRQELIDVVAVAIPSIDKKVFEAALYYLSENLTNPKKAYLQELLTETLLYTIEFMASRRIKTSDLAFLIERLKAMYMGSRINDKNVMHLRKLGDRLVQDLKLRKSTVPTAPERSGVMLYIALRALTKHYFK
jgi:hypothetical protein